MSHEIRLAAGLLFLAWATPAAAQTPIGGGFRVSGEAAVVSDYRFRGVSQSNGDPAVQGEVTLSHDSGFSVTGFASTLSDDLRPGEIELDLDVRYRRDLDLATSLYAGVQLYGFPNNESLTNASYFEPYIGVSHTLGPATATVSARYVPEQEAFAEADSLYVHADLESPLIVLPLTATARVGYTSGPARFTGFSDYLDWRLGVEHSRGPVTLALQYVDTDLPSAPNADPAVVASLRFRF